MERGITTTGYRWFLLLCCLFLVSCGSQKPYRVQYGLASWYGDEDHGQPTASGEIYNQYALTAAHRTLPFGTRVRVTNLRNHRDVVVRINDRGPFVRGRIIDLSYAAAKKIDLLATGVEQVRLEVLSGDGDLPSAPSPREDSGPYSVQVGAFRQKENAEHLQKMLAPRYRAVYVVRSGLPWRRLYRVRIGPFADREQALEISDRLAREGYRPFVTRGTD
ncbi:MAG: septal ring lytic transglycosylase RlpA family protein [Nitrospinota bacterium]|nr:MAG: septal ring lytic transglycosylase RlpA family protein [Nitrospinota bacterium]